MKTISLILLCALSTFAQQTNCLIPGTVSWWRAEGNALDAAGGNSGTWVNGEAYAAGRVGQGFNFNGTNAGIHIPDDLSLRFTNAMTFEAWIYPRNPQRGTVEGLLLKWEGPEVYHRSYTITIEADGRFATSFSPDGSDTSLGQVFSSQPIPANT